MEAKLLATYGYKIMNAMGVKLIAITPSRGSCIELGAALVVIYGTGQGWPLSTTHCQISATVAVGLFAVWKSTSAGVPDNSSLSHFSARTRPRRLNRSVRDHTATPSC